MNTSFSPLPRLKDMRWKGKLSKRIIWCLSGATTRKGWMVKWTKGDKDASLGESPVNTPLQEGGPHTQSDSSQQPGSQSLQGSHLPSRCCWQRISSSLPSSSPAATWDHVGWSSITTINVSQTQWSSVLGFLQTGASITFGGSTLRTFPFQLKNALTVTYFKCTENN